MPLPVHGFLSHSPSAMPGAAPLNRVSPVKDACLVNGIVSMSVYCIHRNPHARALPGMHAETCRELIIAANESVRNGAPYNCIL